jgi:hypothetical protein
MKLVKIFSDAFRSINANRKVLLALLILFSLITFSQFLKKSLVIVLFLVIGSISKIYHRFVKSSLGIDLVFFLTMMLAIVYGPMLAIVIGLIMKIAADYIANRFSHTTLITLAALFIPILFAKALIGLPLVTALFILTLIFEIISSVLYHFIGSSPGNIVLYAVSHFLFNAFLIINLGPWLQSIM